MSDPEQVRTRLLAAGARLGFAGMMVDTRFDRQGELTARDQVLRLRRFIDREGGVRTVIAWKGPTEVSAEGHKQRRELEYSIHSDRAAPEALLEALGYQPIQVIERYVEYYRLGDADVRLEWYPRMDTLVEVEGDPAAIDAAVAASGIPPSAYSAEPLSSFAARYAARTGRPAVTTAAELEGEAPSWAGR